MSEGAPPSALRVRRLGLRPYAESLARMQTFTAARDEHTADELWLLEHPPVYTLGQAGRPEHVLAPGGIEVVRSDRGGQVTYHGPGQLVVYTLIDLRRRRLGVRDAVRLLEQSVIDMLASLGVAGTRHAGAPGVYVGEAKIAALGLRVRHGRCYHGLALNIDVDLAPFSGIDPCGYPGLAVTRVRDLVPACDAAAVREATLAALVAGLRCTSAEVDDVADDWPRKTALAS